MLTLSYGRVKLGQCKVLGLKDRDPFAESTGLRTLGRMEKEQPGKENRPIHYCQDPRLKRGTDARFGKPPLVHIAQSIGWCLWVQGGGLRAVQERGKAQSHGGMKNVGEGTCDAKGDGPQHHWGV